MSGYAAFLDYANNALKSAYDAMDVATNMSLSALMPTVCATVVFWRTPTTKER